MDLKQVITDTALETIKIEISALQALLNSIDESFIESVKFVFKSEGRVIVTGIGKSAIVGQKIVATLNSTGTAAIFMHAADAIHGDLGMIRPSDIVLCLSKSGETSEIKVLLPLIKNLGNLLIGMVSNRASYLGQQADFVLHTPIEQEAEPNNLAPTASTTAQMALGDAFATALLALKGFTPLDFAQFHPGGSLGKRFYLKVSDLYILHEKPTVFESDSLERTILEMTAKRLGATAVLNHANQLTGIITDGDLRRLLEKKQTSTHLTAVQFMSPNPKTIQASAYAVEALNLMRQFSITQLIVLEGKEYVGMVHLHDLLKEGLI